MEPVTIVILTASVITASFTGSLLMRSIWSHIHEKYCRIGYYRRRFMLADAGPLARCILANISDTCKDLSSAVNVTVKHGDATVALMAPYPGEFVDMGNFWVQSVDSGANQPLVGFDVWYRGSCQQAAFTWLERIFSVVPNLTHPYHPARYNAHED